MKNSVLLLILISGYSISYSQTGPDAILPSEKEVPGWRTSGEARVYSKDNLRDFFKDTAELFIEYGLRKAVSRDYYNFFGKVINLQVYTMDNTFGSYGLFLQKSKGEKVFKEFGNSCFEKPGSFVFWKQYYLVIMNSISSGDTISEGFRLLAGVIDSKIKSRGVLPEIIGRANNKKGYPILFKGPLALAEIYYFSPLNIFKINEGIAFENGDSKEIILKYTDNNEAVRMLSDAAGILSVIQKFSGFIMVGDYSFAMKDKEGKTLTFKVDGDCLDIVIK
jgi:hypothetical protein